MFKRWELSPYSILPPLPLGRSSVAGMKCLGLQVKMLSDLLKGAQPSRADAYYYTREQWALTAGVRGLRTKFLIKTDTPPKSANFVLKKLELPTQLIAPLLLRTTSILVILFVA